MATQRKPTPGPWEWKHREFGYYELEAADGSVVHSDGSACGEYGRDVDAPDGPNARLIAAAPEMYEAVRRLVAYADSIGHTPAECAGDERCFYCPARAALAKAEGRDAP